MEKKYFKISLDLLSLHKEKAFPFHLFVFHPLSKTHTPFLYANSPLSVEKFDFLKFIVERGGEISVSQNQKKTLLRDLNLKEEDIEKYLEDLVEEPEHELITLHRERIKKRKKEVASSPKFHFKEKFLQACSEDNFKDLIEETRKEALTLSFTISHTVSLANYLADHLLYEDNHTNRIVALSFQLAKGCAMDDPLALGDILCAAYLSHIGHTQIDLAYSQKPLLTLKKEEQEKYKKHPGLAQHLIKKANLVISERCHKILYQHHERFDGSGYPEYKQGSYIEPLALILGASAHIIEYMSGRITGHAVPLPTIIQNLKKKTLSPGLELEFGDTIYESLKGLMNTVDREEGRKAS